MELDSFLASPRWDILKLISEKPVSPIEIAEKVKTTVSFISQQLKLLEAAQIVSKEKTGAFEKGKPRNLFSISKDLFYLTILTKGFSEKKLLSLTNYQKSILKVWSIEDIDLRNLLEGILFELKEDFESIEGICINKEKGNTQIIFFLENKRIINLIQNTSKNIKRKFNLSFYNISDLNKLNFKEMVFVHQGDLLLEEIKKFEVYKK